MNDTICTFRRKCRKVERLWKSTNLEEHRLHLKYLMLELNEMIKQSRSIYFSNLISSNKKNPKVLFDTIDNLVAPPVSHIPVYSKEDCNDFLRFFVTKVQDIRASITLPQSTFCSVEFAPVCSWSSFTPVCLQDVKELIGKMKLSSSPTDIVPTSLFLKTFDVLGPWVVKLINLSFKSGLVPSFFKHAVVNPILKKPNLDPSEPKKFRPISKLPFVSKVLEKIVAGQLTHFMEQQTCLIHSSLGFENCIPLKLLL